jgi:Bacterial PH domain
MISHDSVEFRIGKLHLAWWDGFGDSITVGREERLLWSAQPRQGLILRSNDVFLIPFSLLWGGFALFWEYSVMGSNAPVLFRLWGIPFVLAGLYLIIGRFFVDARLRSKTFYGLTTERIIIVSGLISRTTKSLQLRTLSDVSLSESASDLGTISFGPQGPWWAAGGGWPGVQRQASPAFEAIPSARAVYEKIRGAQKQA